MITLTREEAQQVLTGLRGDSVHAAKAAIDLLRARLSAPEPKPVAWIVSNSEYDDEFVNNPSALAGRHHRGGNPTPVYTAPPQRERAKCDGGTCGLGGYCDECPNTQPEPEPITELALHKLARRCLWIAYVWNDHNFGAAHEEARRTAEECGIKSFDDANKWLTSRTLREWQSLTDEEARKTFEAHNCVISADLAGILARAIEAKLREKNT